MLERLQKILAQSGYGSRRACEDFITAGRVRVNGQLATLGQKADPAIDKITAALGYSPTHQVADGMAETVTWFAQGLAKPRT